MRNDDEHDAVGFGSRVLLAIAATMTLLLYGAAMALLALPVLLLVTMRALTRISTIELAPPALALEAIVLLPRRPLAVR